MVAEKRSRKCSPAHSGGTPEGVSTAKPTYAAPYRLAMAKKTLGKIDRPVYIFNP